MFTFKEISQTGDYCRTPPGFGERLPVEIWRNYVTDGELTDSDGYAYAYKDGKMTEVLYLPSQQDTLPVDATHVIWMSHD